MQFCQKPNKISFLTPWEDLEILIWRDWSQQPLETVYQKKPEIKTAIKLPHIAAWAEQQQLSSSLSAISHIIGASVEQRSDFGHINTATSFVWPRYKKVVANKFVLLCNNFRTQGPPMTVVPDAGMSHFCLILPDSLHYFIHVSKREIQ